MNQKYLNAIILISLFLLSFYIRGIIPYETTFKDDMIYFAADDAVYHMRLVENLVHNFPHKIWFELFTNYPNGQVIHFGPLWTYLIATTAIIFGLGNPSLELIQTVGAFYPAIFGALMVFPVYVIGKELFNRYVGFMSAFMICIMPGQFLNRSTLGFTDHHIGEVFFSTLVIMFLILAIKNINFYSFKDLLDKKISKGLIYSILAGLSFSLYLLQWSSGIFFVSIIMAFVIVQFIMIHSTKKQSVEPLAVVISTMFFSAAPLLLLVVNPGFASVHYSWLHIVLTAGSGLFIIALCVLSKELKSRKLPTIYYPATLLGIYFIAISVIKISVPTIYDNIEVFFEIFKVNTGGQATIAEAGPANTVQLLGSYPGITPALSSYNLAILGFIILLIYNYKYKSKSISLFLIWSATIFLLTTAQNRWFYYYSVNVSIMLGYLAVTLLCKAGIESLCTKYKKSKTDIVTFLKDNKSYYNLSIIIAIVIVLYVIILPAYSVTINSAKYGVVSAGQNEWYDSLQWFQNNTPNPQIDYNEIYTKDDLPYPEESYGVMSWWDYGHMITYYGHRIPNANPFQAGIGGREDHLPGTSTFFTATTEEQASNVLDSGNLHSKYIISNAYMAYSINNVMGIWNGEPITNYYTWGIFMNQEQAIPKEHWYETMEAKLHIFDGIGLKQYRMVYESNPNPYTLGGNVEQQMKYIYNILYEGRINIDNTGYIKIFERVEGAKIIGTNMDCATALIYTNVTTNKGRTIVYYQIDEVDNGTVEFTVPYSTLGPLLNETQFVVNADRYGLVCDDIEAQLHISEYDVLNGNEMVVNFNV